MNPPLMHFFYALIALLFIVSIMMVLERGAVSEDKARHARNPPER